MPRPRAPWLPLLAACVLLTACEDIPLGPELGLPDRAPGARPGTSTRTDTAPLPPAVALPRATRDRKDDHDGFQIKVFYVLPSDGQDGDQDEAGIPGSVAAWNAWFEGQTGGQAMRLDTHEGALDLSFFRSKLSSAELRVRGLKVIDAIDREVREAGFNHPMKLHAYYYGGPIDLAGDAGGQTLGVGGSGRAMVFLRQFQPGVTTRRIQGVGPLEWTMAHEIVHALGYVGECAPNRADDAHVLDDEADLMHPSTKPGLFPILDKNRDDYFRHGKPGCIDLGKSVYFAPTPADAEAPLDAPVTLSAGAGALTVGPEWGPGAFRSRAAVEARLLELLNQARAQAGLTSWRPHPGLSTIARRRANEYAGGGQGSPIPELSLKAGYAGTLRGGGATLPLSGGSTDAAAIAALEAAMEAGLGESFRRLATDGAMSEAGVGAWIENDTLYMAYMTGHSEFDVADVRIGEGPLNTYTLAGRARYKGPAAPEARVSVDDQLYRAGVLSPGRDWFDFVASVPREGVHTVTLMIRKQGDRFSGPVSLFEIDGDRPLAEAVLSAPAPVDLE